MGVDGRACTFNGGVVGDAATGTAAGGTVGVTGLEAICTGDDAAGVSVVGGVVIAVAISVTGDDVAGVAIGAGDTAACWMAAASSSLDRNDALAWSSTLSGSLAADSIARTASILLMRGISM